MFRCFGVAMLNYRLQITDYRLQITDYRLQITDYRLQITTTPDDAMTRKTVTSGNP